MNTHLLILFVPPPHNYLIYKTWTLTRMTILRPSASSVADSSGHPISSSTKAGARESAPSISLDRRKGYSETPNYVKERKNSRLSLATSAATFRLWMSWTHIPAGVSTEKSNAPNAHRNFPGPS